MAPYGWVVLVELARFGSLNDGRQAKDGRVSKEPGIGGGREVGYTQIRQAEQ